MLINNLLIFDFNNRTCFNLKKSNAIVKFENDQIYKRIYRLNFEDQINIQYETNPELSNLKDLIPYKREKRILGLLPYNLSDLFLENINSYNEHVRKENEEIKKINENIEKENKILRDTYPDKEILSIDFSKDSFLNKKLIEDLKFSYPIYSFESIVDHRNILEIFFKSLEEAINQPIIIRKNNTDYVCRLYEVLDYQKMVNSKKNAKFRFFLPYTENGFTILENYQDIRYIRFPDKETSINWESLCQFKRLDIFEFSDLFYPFILSKQIEVSKKSMSQFKILQKNMQSFESPLLKTNEQISLAIDNQLTEYSNNMLKYSEKFNNIVKNMNL